VRLIIGSEALPGWDKIAPAPHPVTDGETGT